MRLFESILLIALTVLVYQSVFTTKIKERPMPLIIFTLIVIFCHLMVENYRWQLIPAYFSFGFLYLRAKTSQIKFTQRYNKITWATWIIIAISLPLAVPVFDLPEPTGPYPIGTHIAHWVDSSRTEWFTPEDPDDVRELMVQIWYPAENETQEFAAYIDRLDLRAETIGEAGDIPGFLVSHLDLIKTHSYLDAFPAKSNRLFPVLILSHGITGMRQLHTSLIEELASNGYIVVAPDHTYDCNLTIFPNGRLADYRSDITGHPDSIRVRRQQLNTRVADIHFILKKLAVLNHSELRFAGLLDLDNIGILGHSFGGATAIQSAYEDSLLKAVLSLDSWMNPLPGKIIEEGIHQPFLYIGRPSWSDSDYPTSPDLLRQFSKILGKNHFLFTLENSRHLDFSDAPLFSPLSGFFLETGTISARKAVLITNKVVLSFFDRYLKNADNHFPESVSGLPELIMNPAF